MAGATLLVAQSPVQSCEAKPQSCLVQCRPARRARLGWPAQRDPKSWPEGMVVTSQPLAAQAGVQVLMTGGNAIDAAVATASVLSLVEPMMVGVASDLFAVIYIAKERKCTC